jgi:hypothetical protein
MVYRIAKNDADHCEETNESRTEIDMLLGARKPHFCFAQGPLDGSAKPANSDQQSDGSENANVGPNDRESHRCEDDNDVNKLTNKKKLQLALRRHGLMRFR